MDLRIPINLAYDAVAAARQVATAAAARADGQDRDDGFPAEDVADLARLGLLTAPIPSDEGGLGLGEEPDMAEFATVLRLVGYGSLALGRIYEGHVNALQLVARYGTPTQRARLFADVRDGHLFGVWNTDPPGDCLKLGDDRRLRGVKTFASGAGFVTRALVTVKHEPGASPLMLVVPLEPGSRADLTGWRAHGMRASATGTVDFEDIVVTEEEILGGWDDYHRQPVFSGGAWRFAAVQLGGIEAVFDAWRGHLAATGRGGDPHQLARLGEGAIALEGARGWVERAACLVAEDEFAPDRIVAFVNLARLAVEKAGLDVLQLAQRSVGLQGFMREHPLERLSRDLATYLRQPAPDRALATAAAEILGAGGIAGDLFELRSTR
ncbi:alkylation response protein AidB-like acyl-CoA dehydrogenase [Methylobacterium sp. PvP062]|jgi:alkylation response protein AidB-like acyl-CoA dehydrogenase|uniref:Acyl-CoA dehydrogenase, short-chain specific n=2 Tax=Methylobacterium TaxID=407 RepID=A0A509E9S2_9HYPH|nr:MULTISPECIES: acyl-CoA dehydrogenase family protein [Methylobacterium]MCX7333290.1 acyl-CoA/acyl-ACP dehydrogenase [Hyphomicrobiales bacterium]GAN46013.1 cyclic nucleotide-binding protein [Methylobacterium sp. ME121]MBN6818470.1 acyl-CoA/acyl-ACP dehydrogenase [Methylobacterium organophilum]MBP2492891.1 alkylation response protein AidB-like acyl-CoA dehydrogenase [Methylobacterium sp. PvP105]MBP2500737.1 alkylation response protein AidB-like acyl-CoA dehydrogenase [Methylobacterium sp. PvP1